MVEQDEAVRLIGDILYAVADDDDSVPLTDYLPEEWVKRADEFMSRTALATPSPAAPRHDPTDHDCRGGVRGDRYPLAEQDEAVRLLRRLPRFGVIDGMIAADARGTMIRLDDALAALATPPPAVPPALDELERLLEAATPGPWQAVEESKSYYFLSGTFVVPTNPEDADDPLMVAYTGHGGDVSQPDAALIVAAINSLPALIAAARRAEALEKALRNADEWINFHWDTSPDWACAECRPTSDMLVEGFRCTPHEAIARMDARATLTGEGAPR